MINANNPKVREAVERIHRVLQSKVKRGNRSQENIVTESRLFSTLCQDFENGPRRCAIAMHEKYGQELTEDEIIQIFRSRRINNPVERKEVLQWADEVSRYFAGAISGRKDSFEKYEKKRREPALKNGKKHNSQERMAVIMIYEKYPELDVFDDVESLHLLGDTLARYFFLDISDVLSEVYDFPQHHEKKKQAGTQPEKKISYEQALRRIEHLENNLERTNTMLQELQDEFDEQLETSKVKELADFFARLNSERYGCILDELLVIQKGVNTLRKNNYELPIEINGLLIMVKKLIQFVKDSHIEPIMKINSTLEVVASDVEFCNYEGSPFVSPDDKKQVKVVSPGWLYKDKDLQISRPKVKEE